MAKNKNTNEGFSAVYWVIILMILGMPLCFLRYNKEKPIPVMYDERIQVHMVKDVLVNALQNKAEDWGEYKIRWSANIFRKEAAGLVIEAKPDQEFYDILHIDSAAMCISRDYPHLFRFEYMEDGSCRFRMARKQGPNGYVVMPTWLLVELIERDVLTLPESVQ